MTKPPPYQRLSAAKAHKMIADQGLTLARVQSRPNVKLYVDSLGRETVLHRFICSTYYFRDWSVRAMPVTTHNLNDIIRAPLTERGLHIARERCPDCIKSGMFQGPIWEFMFYFSIDMTTNIIVENTFTLERMT